VTGATSCWLRELGGVGRPDRDRVGVVAGGGLHGVELHPRRIDVAVQRGHHREHRGRDQPQVAAERVLTTAGQVVEHGRVGSAQVPERLADIADTPPVDAPGVYAVRASDRVGGRPALFKQLACQLAGAVELYALGVRGPAGEEEVGGLTFAAEPSGDVLGPPQQVDGRAGVPGPHPVHRGQQRQGGQLQLRQARRPGDLRGRAQLPRGGLEAASRRS
jgi:hypothetical protein